MSPRSRSKSNPQIHTHLSRRETQIMDAVYRLGEATVGEVLKDLDDPPGYNAVRVTLGILEDKGFLTHRQDGRRYVYRPVVAREQARRSALQQVLDTFFHGSPSDAVATLLDMSSARLSERDLEEIGQMIEKAGRREEGSS